MTGMIRKATIFVALGLMASSAVMAGIPSPGNCTIPAFVKVVGTNGVPDPLGVGTVTVLDVSLNPVVGSNVTLNFTNCTDTELCGAAVSVSATTDAFGVATFTAIGGGKHPGGIFPGAGAGCIEIRADSYLLGTATAVVYDLNGANLGGNGVSISDLPLFLDDWGDSGTYRGRSDFNQDGSIQITDLPVWLAFWGLDGSALGCP